jgi:hypothetical protein
MIDFDDIFEGGFVDEERADPNDVGPRAVLVVAERAASGAELHDEERVAKYLMEGSPFVIFIEEDDDDPDAPEVFANARAWADAMGSLSLPTEAEARAWEAQLITDRILAYAERER